MWANPASAIGMRCGGTNVWGREAAMEPRSGDR